MEALWRVMCYLGLSFVGVMLMLAMIQYLVAAGATGAGISRASLNTFAILFAAVAAWSALWAGKAAWELWVYHRSR